MIAVAGKLGRVRSVVAGATVDHEFEDWLLTDTPDIIPTDGFEKVIDAQGSYRKTGIEGLVGGKATLKGLYNSAKSPFPAFTVSKSITSIFLGYTAAVGVTITSCIVMEVRIGTNVKQAGTFEVDIFINAITYPSS